MDKPVPGASASSYDKWECREGAVASLSGLSLCSPHGGLQGLCTDYSLSLSVWKAGTAEFPQVCGAVSWLWSATDVTVQREAAGAPHGALRARSKNRVVRRLPRGSRKRFLEE